MEADEAGFHYVKLKIIPNSFDQGLEHILDLEVDQILLPFMVRLLPFMVWLCCLLRCGSVTFRGVALLPFIVWPCCLSRRDLTVAFHGVA